MQHKVLVCTLSALSLSIAEGGTNGLFPQHSGSCSRLFALPTPAPSLLAHHDAQVMDKARIPTLTFFSMAPVVALVSGSGAGRAGRMMAAEAERHMTHGKMGCLLLQPAIDLQRDASRLPLPAPAPALQATPMGLRAKQSVRARNRVLLLGMAALIAANACFALVPSYPGELLGACVCHTCVRPIGPLDPPLPPAHLPTHPPTTPCLPAPVQAWPRAMPSSGCTWP